jgi:hypothetical protein
VVLYYQITALSSPPRPMQRKRYGSLVWQVASL